MKQINSDTRDFHWHNGKSMKKVCLQEHMKSFFVLLAVKVVLSVENHDAFVPPTCLYSVVNCFTVVSLQQFQPPEPKDC